MAVLLDKKSGNEVFLRSHHVFGRAKAKTDTCINDSTISLVHASIRWNGNAWELVDHSRNGVWLNNERLSKTMPLQQGDEIAFKRDGTETWTLSNDSAPQNMLVAMTEGANDIILDSMHVLPDEENPRLALFLLEQSKWVLSEANVEKELVDGDIVSLEPDLRWRFQMVLPASETLNIALDNNRNEIKHCKFEFHVSADEEHTSLNIDFNNENVNFGERAHHYLLLTLARKRYEDHKCRVGEDSEGWVDISDLQKMLGMDSCHINIHIYRARQQIKKYLKTENGIELLERRFGSIRFAGKNYQIYRAGNLESSYQSCCV